MDWLWISIGAILMVVGLIGCILPIIPGPPISFFGLLMMQLTEKYGFSSKFILIWALVATAVTVLDYVVPVWGTKKYGGSKKGVWGSMIGLFLGLLFFPPLGIIIGPFMGAFVGELMAGKQSSDALRSGFGSFLGFLAGTLLKIIASGWMFWAFFAQLF
ncbi:MAG: DUF456 domain-containing protein [Bacteroidales bacterium]|nr:DUF456 domain-containing protein [Bacteroidales bacterium]